MKKFYGKCICVLLTCISTLSFACTDFRLKATDGTVLITRSMEFAADFKSNLRTSPRGRVFTTTAPDGQSGLSWKAKYGFVFLDGLNIDTAIDGMNEAGLSMEILYLPNFAQYQLVPPGRNNQALPYLDLGNWILSNFQSVDEVRQALLNIYVFAAKIPGMGDTIFPVHYSIFDATGKGIVVEYVGGRLHIYDHIGILTNSPPYDWQTTNLVNYIHLTPTNPPNVIANGITYAATGQGYGLIGLPGDVSPPSRFVKTSVLTRLSLPTKNAADALNTAQHIINNVDIVLGEVREPSTGNYIAEKTQWVVFKDLTHKVFYYRTYDDMTLHGIDLSKLNLAENAVRLKMPIAAPMTVQNMTTQFSQSTK